MPVRNPFEETRQAAQDWSPREQYISRSNQGGLEAISNAQRFNADRFVDVGRPRSYPQEQSPMDSGVFSVRINDPSVNEIKNNYMQVADYSPDFRGRWMTQSPTGNKFLSYLVNQFGSEGSSEYLEDILGTGGISAFGGTFSPNFERRDDGWNLGFTGKWNL